MLKGRRAHSILGQCLDIIDALTKLKSLLHDNTMYMSSFQIAKHHPLPFMDSSG